MISSFRRGTSEIRAALGLHATHSGSFLLFSAAQSHKTAQIVHYHFIEEACFVPLLRLAS